MSAPVALLPGPGPSRRFEGWRRFLRSSGAALGLGIVAVIVLMALLAPVITPYPQHAGAFVDFANASKPPSAQHWLGTDVVGRDLLTRIIFGYRTSLLLVVVVLSIGIPVGVLLGLVAGYYGGWIEAVIMRVTDIFLALPPLALVLAVTSVLTPTLVNAMIAIGALWWTWHTRLVHGLVVGLKNEDFIEAARRAGASDAHLLFRELLPNVISTVAVKTTLDAAFVILLGSGLSFLGLGATPPTPDLGTMVSEGSKYLPSQWWESIFPGLAIVLISLGFNLLGDGLREYFDVDVQR
ncbi:ABC transporter permease [Deinococcus rubellus]|uniref:ABC transporter permease n=1 Tax=Deinococcus rubellus TaxID=1889240 RepID=UPI0031E84B66